MAERFPRLTDEHRAFIAHQHVYFVGSAGADGRVNVSPKGGDTLRVLDANTVVWLNLTGSGNETAAHVRENGRMTLMFCSFDREPLILRVYGEARVVHPFDAAWSTYEPLFPAAIGARQFFVFGVDLVQTSCGFAVPHYTFTGERDTLTQWADRRGRTGIEAYWLKNNRLSLDGKPTGVVDG